MVRLVPGGGLAAHEAAGGHTLAKHVGKSEEYLRERLASEPNLKSASTFYTRELAENAIAGLIEAERSAIHRWLAGQRHQLELVAAGEDDLGVLLRPGHASPTSERGLKVILRRTPPGDSGFYVHTAMVTT